MTAHGQHLVGQSWFFPIHSLLHPFHTAESLRGLGRSPCLGDSGLRAGAWSAPLAGSSPPGTPGLTSRSDSAVSSSGPGIPFGGGIADGKMSFMGEPPGFLPVHKDSWLAAAVDPASTPLLIS